MRGEKLAAFLKSNFKEFISIQIAVIFEPDEFSMLAVLFKLESSSNIRFLKWSKRNFKPKGIAVQTTR